MNRQTTRRKGIAIIVLLSMLLSLFPGAAGAATSGSSSSSALGAEAELEVGVPYVVPYMITSFADPTKRLADHAILAAFPGQDERVKLVKNADGTYTVTMQWYSQSLIENFGIVDQKYNTTLTTLTKIGENFLTTEDSILKGTTYVNATYNQYYTLVTNKKVNNADLDTALYTFDITNPNEKIGFGLALYIPKYGSQAKYAASYGAIVLDMDNAVKLADLKAAVADNTVYWKTASENGSTATNVGKGAADIATSTQSYPSAEGFMEAFDVSSVEASLTADGRYQATIAVNDEADALTPLKVYTMQTKQVITEGLLANEKYYNYSRRYGTTWSDNLLSEDGSSFTVTFDNDDELIYGKYVCFDTEGSIAASTATAKYGYRYGATVQLTLEKPSIVKVVATDDVLNSGITISAKSNIIPEGTKLQLQEITAADKIYGSSTYEVKYSAYSNLKMYRLGFVDADGNAVKGENGVYQIQIDVSAWGDSNLDDATVTFFTNQDREMINFYGKNSLMGIGGAMDTFEVENGILTLTYKMENPPNDEVSRDVMNGGVLVCTAPAYALSPDDIAKLSAGVYTVDAHIYKGSGQISMSNEALNHKATLVKQEDGSAAVYLDFHSLEMIGARWWIGGMWPYDKPNSYVYEDCSTVLGYATKAIAQADGSYTEANSGPIENDDDLIWNAIYNPYTGWPCVSAMKIDLVPETFTYTNTGYFMGIVAPAMASLTGVPAEQISKTDLFAELHLTNPVLRQDVTLDTFVAPTYQPSVLRRAIGVAEALNSADYTAASYTALQDVLQEVKTEYAALLKTASENGGQLTNPADGAAVLEQVEKLEAAQANLVAKGNIDKTTLSSLLEKAKTETSDRYTETSWKALQAAIAAAEAVMQDTNVTQAQVDQQAALLEAAMNALITNVELKEGQYKIPVRLQNAMTTADSMGNESLNPEAILTVTEDKATLQLEFGPMEFSLFTGYLGYLKAIDEDTIEKNESEYPIAYEFLDNLAVTQWFTISDLYNTPEKIAELRSQAEAMTDAAEKEKALKRVNKIEGCYQDLVAYNEQMQSGGVYYPQLYEMTVDIDKLDSEMWVEVYAAVMGELTSAQQVARLMIDWTPYTEENIDTTALDEAIAAASKMTQGDASDSSWAALQAALAAAVDFTESTKIKSQVQYDAQAALLLAAIDAVKVELVVDTEALASAIEVAEQYTDAEGYTASSLAALDAAVKAATALQSAAATNADIVQADVNAAAKALEAAVDALVEVRKDVTDLEPGQEYDIPVSLLNESGEGAAVAQPILENTAQLTVQADGDSATLTLNFKQLEVGGTTASYLAWIQPTTGSALGYVAETYDVTDYWYDVKDEYNQNSAESGEFNGNYVKTVTVEIPLYTPSLAVTMHIPGIVALGSSMNGMRTSEYQIALDWSDYQKIEASESALADLHAALAEASAVYNQKDDGGLVAIDAIWNALNAAVQSGNALSGNDADVAHTIGLLDAVVQMIRVTAPEITVVDYDAASGAEGNSTVYAKINSNSPNADTIWYSLNGGAAQRYTGNQIALTGSSQNIRLRAWASQAPVRDSVKTYVDVYFNVAVEEPTPDTPATPDNPSIGGGGGSGSTDKENNYYVPVELYNAYKDEPSMGDVAFENNRQALAVLNSDGTYDIYVATNPVNVSGYRSAIISISSSSYNVSAENKESYEAYDGKDTHNISYISLFKIAKVPYGKEFITVDFEVPYTPMDEVVQGGLHARLRFDWSGAEATSDTSLSANSEAAKGATDLLSESVDITDDATGVRLVAEEDVLPDGTALTVDAITSGSSFDTASKALDGIAEAFKLYNIVVKADGEEVEPSTTVKLYLPIPSDYDSSKVAVYRINDDGTKVVVKGTVEDGKYVIETKTFGLYAVALTDTVQQVVVNTTYDEAVAKVVAKYPDINNHWAASSIAFVVNRGLMGSVADEQFGPNLQLTRGMLVTILGRLEGFDASKYAGNSSFSDVSTAAWYAAAVQWAAEQGIVSGIGDGKFAPEQAITREQLAAILTNYASYKDIQLKNGPSIKFADSSKISPWAKEAMDAMVKAGIIRGNADGTLNPQGTATRAETAAMLQRFIVNYVDASVEQDAAQV